MICDRCRKETNNPDRALRLVADIIDEAYPRAAV